MFTAIEIDPELWIYTEAILTFIVRQDTCISSKAKLRNKQATI